VAQGGCLEFKPQNFKTKKKKRKEKKERKMRIDNSAAS
jgi:hypothetical protein